MPLIAVQVLDGASYAFTSFFILEMMIKISGLGIKGYVSDNYNIFDGIVTILSLVQMAIQLSGGSFAAISALRALRVFRLLRYLPSFKGTVAVVLGSLRSALCIAFLVVLYMFVVGLLGGIVSCVNLSSCFPSYHLSFRSFAYSSSAISLTHAQLRDPFSFVLLVSQHKSALITLIATSLVLLTLLSSGLQSLIHLMEDKHIAKSSLGS